MIVVWFYQRDDGDSGSDKMRMAVEVTEVMVVFFREK